MTNNFIIEIQKTLKFIKNLTIKNKQISKEIKKKNFKFHFKIFFPLMFLKIRIKMELNNIKS